MTHNSNSQFEDQLAQRARQIEISPPPGMANHILMTAASMENTSPSRTRFHSRQRGMVGVAVVLLVLATSIVGTAIAGQAGLSPGLRESMSSWLGIDADDVSIASETVEATDQGVTVSASGVFNNGVLVAIAVETHDPTEPELVHQINVGWDEGTGKLAQTSLRTADGRLLEFAGLATDPNEHSRMLVLYGATDGESLAAEDFVLEIVGAKRYASGALVDDVNGEWTLSLSIPRTEETQDLAALDAGTVGPVDVAFGVLKYSEAFIGGSIHLTAPTPEDLAPGVSAELKTDIVDLEAGTEFIEPEAAERAETGAADQAPLSNVDAPNLSGERAAGIRIDLYAPDGEHVNPIYTTGWPAPGDGQSSADVVAFWPRGEAGTYRLVISYDGDAAMEWALRVP